MIQRYFNNVELTQFTSDQKFVNTFAGFFNRDGHPNSNRFKSFSKIGSFAIYKYLKIGSFVIYKYLKKVFCDLQVFVRVVILVFTSAHEKRSLSIRPQSASQVLNRVKFLLRA